MTREEFLGDSTVSRKDGGAARTGLPNDVDKALGEPEDIAYFLDRDTGEVIVVPIEEVGLR